MPTTAMQTLGHIDNSDIFLAAATVVSLALFLPASREGAAVYFCSRIGRVSFFTTLGLLVVSATLTAWSTMLAFMAFIASLLSAVGLGLLALQQHAELGDQEQRAEHIVEARRAKEILRSAQTRTAGIGTRCLSLRNIDGERCRNQSATGFCAKHAD